jgi:adenosylhomocysteine nucleosidase
LLEGREFRKLKRQMSLSPATLVCFAVKEEAAYFNRFARRRADLKVLITGMGQRNAREAVQRALAEAPPRLVLSCGFAGGLKPELDSGLVLFSTEGEAALESRMRTAGAQPARFHCADRVVGTVGEKQALREWTGADAVEMESGAVCAICGERGIACAIVRVVLDTASESLPLDFNRMMTADNRIDNWKLMLAVLSAPWKIPRLRQFQKQSQSAAQRLSEVLVQVFGAGAVPRRGQTLQS